MPAASAEPELRDAAARIRAEMEPETPSVEETKRALALAADAVLVAARLGYAQEPGRRDLRAALRRRGERDRRRALAAGPRGGRSKPWCAPSRSWPRCTPPTPGEDLCEEEIQRRDAGARRRKKTKTTSFVFLRLCVPASLR